MDKQSSALPEILSNPRGTGYTVKQDLNKSKYKAGDWHTVINDHNDRGLNNSKMNSVDDRNLGSRKHSMSSQRTLKYNEFDMVRRSKKIPVIETNPNSYRMYTNVGIVPK